MKKLLITLAVLFALQSSAQQKSILFLGNSYTYTANLPGTLYNLALAGGDTIYHESNTPGGYTLEGHSTNATSLAKIASREWDFVVLQEQSQKPSFPPSQVASETYPYAEILVDSIKSNYECTEPIFFMTWGRRDGDQQNCQFYTPLCTFEGMNARLRESYLEMGADNDATVAPCGAAWQQMKLQNSTFWNGLYSGDGSHPSAWGTYLNACIFYATIFRQSPVGIPYYSSIGQQDAEDLQQLAEDMVLDSLSNWYIGHQDVTANLSYQYQGGLTVSFEGQSNNATEHFWTFGDGTTSSEQNPTHTYASPNTYQVSYEASSSCGNDLSYGEFTLSPFGFVSVNEMNPFEKMEILISDNSMQLSNLPLGNKQLEILDVTGRLMHSETLASHSGVVALPSVSGFYVLRLRSKQGQHSLKFLVQ